MTANPVRPGPSIPPVPAPNGPPGPTGSDIPTPNPHSFSSGDISDLHVPDHIQRRGSSVTSSCVAVFGAASHSWTVNIAGQQEPSAQGTGPWGGGFLDNLRGQCGDISQWEASLDGVAAPNTGIRTTFTTTIFCSFKNVQDAAWLESDPNNRVSLKCGF